MLTQGRKVLTTGVVLATTLWSVMSASLVAPMAQAAGCTSGALIKGSQAAVYYCGADGQRYVFPNEKTYFTWYPSFVTVQTITDAELASLTLGGVVTYRPGIKMIKLESVPKVYAVSHDGVLRWVTDASIASCLYGASWNVTSVDDLSIAFYPNYTVGSDITACSQYDKFAEQASSQTINQDKGLFPPGPDVTRPTIVSTDPTNGSTNVAVSKTLSATFSEAMNASTINSSTFTLTGPGTTPVSGSVTYGGNTAFFDPTLNLAINTTYTATITTGVTDAAGNHLATNYSWFFTTGPTPVPDTTAPTVISTDPTNAASNVALNKTVTATFSEAMNPATINNSTFTLMGPGSTPVVGTVTYSGNTAAFDPTSNLVANTTFTATITTGVTDTSGNHLAANYTWFFTTGTNPDTTAPTVTSTDPANGATNVVITKTVSATFSEAMNAASINSTTFTLTGPGTTPVAGTVSYVSSTNTALFDPTADLASSTTYTATITTGAEDAAGNNLAVNHTWVFTTGPDVTAPTVTSTTPATGATNVAVAASVTATFSEQMSAATINNTTFTLANGGAVAGTVTYDAATRTATFDPTLVLANSTTYTATITTGAQDASGNNLASNYTWTFTTAP